MPDILSLIGCQAQDGDVGIEVEMEADNFPSSSYVRNYWRIERDHSLRGESGEFVLKKPLNIQDVPKAFSELKSAMDLHATVVRPTYRAGVHVHVNVQTLTGRQLVSFIASYLILEEVFLSYCDKSRSGNHFCLRMGDASYTLDMLYEAITKSDLSILNTEDLRYASLNITSLFKYGSVEFRALESTTNFDKIYEWAKALNNLKNFAKTISDPSSILGEASALGFTEFAKSMLGDSYPVFAPFMSEEKIRKGIHNIQYALYSRNWSVKDKNIFNKNVSIFAS